MTDAQTSSMLHPIIQIALPPLITLIGTSFLVYKASKNLALQAASLKLQNANTMLQIIEKTAAATTEHQKLFIEKPYLRQPTLFKSQRHIL